MICCHGKRSSVRSLLSAFARGAVVLCCLPLVLPAALPYLDDIPNMTVKKGGTPGDPVNIVLIGSWEDVVDAMVSAGWRPAAQPTLVNLIREVGSIAIYARYACAPVSDLYLWGRRQDMAFERMVSRSPRRRHHVRVWRAPAGPSGGIVRWAGAATFDRSAGFSHRTVEPTHHIDPDIDAERSTLVYDLMAAGRVAEVVLMPGIGRTFSGRNGEGDRYYTDGNRAVVMLASPAP